MSARRQKTAACGAALAFTVFAGVASAQTNPGNTDTIGPSVNAPNEDFLWYTPTQADSRLPIPTQPPPPPAPHFVEIHRYSGVALDIGFRHLFIGAPTGVDMDIALRWDITRVLGVSLSLMGPGPVGMFGVDIGRGYGITVYRFPNTWADLAVLPPSGRIRVGTDLITPVLQLGGSLVGLRVTCCERWHFDARLEGPDLWLSFPGANNGAHAGPNVAGGWGGTFEAGVLY
jgi:hypothetical protein